MPSTTRDPWVDVHTLHGFAADQVISALQKEIRRGHTENAVLLAYDMARTSPALEDYLWQRLLVIAVEDIGFGEPQARRNDPGIIEHEKGMLGEIAINVTEYVDRYFISLRIVDKETRAIAR